jgi:hypothetical protein
MKILLLASVLVVACASAAAQAESCPVTITDVRNIENAMYVLFDNASPATLTSYQFGFTFIDSKGVAHKFPLAPSGSVSVKTGGSGRLVFPTSQTMQYLFPEANAYLLKATFADGSTWTDDGRHACGATSWQE